jgi:hypothetical protein
MRAKSVNNTVADQVPGHWLPRTINELSVLGADFTTGSLRGEMLHPRILFEMAVRLGLISAETLASVLPGKQGISLQELANKIGAWHLFSYADRLVAVSANSTLTEIIERVSQLDPFSAVWVTEGLGHFYARNALRRDSYQGLYRTREADRISAQVMIPLHTGAGLAIAENALQGADASHLQQRLQSLWRLCVESARGAYAEMVFEALGLVAITLFPHLVVLIDQELARSARSLVAYFWHGVGRGLYFSPSTFIPVAATRATAIDMSQRLPSTEEGRRNALAGLAWALTLVNIRHPQIVEQCLSDHEQQIFDLDAFSNGMTSAMRVWSVTAPEDPHLGLVRNFHSSVNVWDRVLRKDFERAGLFDESPGALFRVSASNPCWTC